MMKIKVAFTALLTCLALIPYASAQESDVPILKGPYLGQELPGDTPVLFAPGMISKPDSKEMGCTWMPDMKEFYFTRQGTPLSPDIWAIWYTKEVDGKWTEPQIVPFSGKYLDIAPFITFDGKYMLFYRGSRTDTTVQKGTYIAERKGDSWSEPKYFDDAYVLVTPNFKDFYCTIDSEDGKMNRQIAGMTYNDGVLSKKVPLKGQVNTDHFEAHSYISPNGDYILYDSDRPGGFDQIDIYVSFIGENQEWSEGVNLGEKINKGYYTIPSLTPDGKYLFINVDGDIYWTKADFIETLRPKK
jgi:Tol biopolymer transport system component